MDSDDDDQIGFKKQSAKKGKVGRGAKKSTTASTTPKSKANKKTTTITTRCRRIKNQLIDSSSEDEQSNVDQNSLKKQKLNEDHSIEIQSNLEVSQTSALHSLSQVDDLLSFKKQQNSDKLNELTTLTTLPTLATASLSTQIFTTATSRLNSVPLHENKPLNWSHKINLIGEKSIEQRVHLCDICKEPILYYGRLLPCKHVYCYDCAIERHLKGDVCERCNERTVRCERSALNSVYMCNHDQQCKRTYLSQRDLLAHIQHRHTKKEKSNSSSEKSLKIRSHPSFKNTNIKDYQSPFAQSTKLSNNNGHHYPQSSLQTFRWVKNIQNYTEQNLKDGRKLK